MSSHSNVVSGHYNNLKEAGLSYRNESRILYLRNFNNWVKSNLIQNIISNIYKDNKEIDVFDLDKDNKEIDVLDLDKDNKKIDVLDLGSGKGGDQMKWGKAGVSHVTFLDIAEVSVEQSKDRFNSRRFRYTADFVVRDFTKGFSDILSDKRFHLISCQFAYHYSFESYDQALSTIRSVSKCLHKGGYFIGTTVNAFELAKRRKEAAANSFGNEVYKVTFDSEQEEMKLFGEKYHFYLEGSVDCPEFLVYPPLMDEMAANHDLELVKRTSFPDFYKENVDTPSGWDLISRIKALKEFYINDLAGAREAEYSAAKQYDDSNRYHKVLSISKSEWEIIEMYDLFIYRKV